jgi:hypothetical protein
MFQLWGVGLGEVVVPVGGAVPVPDGGAVARAGGGGPVSAEMAELFLYFARLLSQLSKVLLSLPKMFH